MIVESFGLQIILDGHRICKKNPEIAMVLLAEIIFWKRDIFEDKSNHMRFLPAFYVIYIFF